jgi:hypothetical protein
MPLEIRARERSGPNCRVQVLALLQCRMPMLPTNNTVREGAPVTATDVSWQDTRQPALLMAAFAALVQQLPIHSDRLMQFVNR